MNAIVQGIEMKTILNKHIKNAGTFVVASVVVVVSATSVGAATTSDTFTAQIVITEDCDIVSAGNLDFGSEGVLASNIDASSTLSVQCTNSTTYDIGLSAGLGSGATTTTRKMMSGTEFVDYQLFSDSGRSTNWGNSIAGGDTVSSTGDGSANSHIIYGRVPAQSTPSAGTYLDTVTVEVTF